MPKNLQWDKGISSHYHFSFHQSFNNSTLGSVGFVFFFTLLFFLPWVNKSICSGPPSLYITLKSRREKTPKSKALKSNQSMRVRFSCLFNTIHPASSDTRTNPWHTVVGIMKVWLPVSLPFAPCASGPTKVLPLCSLPAPESRLDNLFHCSSACPLPPPRHRSEWNHISEHLLCTRKHLPCTVLF